MRPAFLLALAASLGLHAAALFLPEVALPSPPPVILQAELQLPPPAPSPPSPPVPEEAPAPLPSPPPKPPKPPKSPKSSSPRHAAPPAPRPVMTAPGPEMTVPEPGSAATPAEAPGGESAAQAAPPAPLAKPLLPARGVIRFLVYRGNQGFLVGRAEHAWEFTAEGNYRLTAMTETSGLAAFFRPVRMELESRGRLTGQGLRPERFTTRKNGQETNENAVFDWEANTVKIQREAAPRPVAEGAQDLLSFHYQLAYLKKLSDGVLMGVASGKKYERYAFDYFGEELLETPAGVFHALHLRVQTDTTTELWLAVERQLLPVKIRFTDKKGESFEQIATEIGLKADPEASPESTK